MASNPPGALLRRTRLAQLRVAPFLVAAVTSLLLGLWAGLIRIGWEMPRGDATLALRHGALMVAGFVGTVIAIERAVAVRSLPAFAAPAFSAAAAVALLTGRPDDLAPPLATISAVLYTLNLGVLARRHPEPAIAILVLGGVALAAAGATWWSGEGLPRVLPWWMVFLALTVGGERLEIIRFQRFSRFALGSGLLVAALLVAGASTTVWNTTVGARLMGVALLLGPGWLAPRDIARRTVRTKGLARFTAAGVLTAYGWLAVAGVLLLLWGLDPGPHYDASVHAFFAGFVFSAIIAHEPIIAAAVTGLRFVYSPVLYVPLATLNSALAARVGADIAGWLNVRKWAGLIQVIAILLFLALTIASALLGRRAAPARPIEHPRQAGS